MTMEHIIPYVECAKHPLRGINAVTEFPRICVFDFISFYFHRRAVYGCKVVSGKVLTDSGELYLLELIICLWCRYFFQLGDVHWIEAVFYKMIQRHKVGPLSFLLIIERFNCRLAKQNFIDDTSCIFLLQSFHPFVSGSPIIAFILFRVENCVGIGVVVLIFLCRGSKVFFNFLQVTYGTWANSVSKRIITLPVELICNITHVGSNKFKGFLFLLITFGIIIHDFAINIAFVVAKFCFHYLEPIVAHKVVVYIGDETHSPE